MWFLDPCLWYLRRECRSPVPTTDIMLAVAVMRLIKSHLDIWIDVPEHALNGPGAQEGRRDPPGPVPLFPHLGRRRDRRRSRAREV